MTTRRDAAIAAIGAVRPLLCGADRYAIADAVLAAIDIHDMQVELAERAPKRDRNEYAGRLAAKVRQNPPPGETIEVHP